MRTRTNTTDDNDKSCNRPTTTVTLNVKTAQSYIEILEQEINYDLEEVLIDQVEIDVNYEVVAPDTLNTIKRDTIEINHEYIDADEIE